MGAWTWEISSRHRAAESGANGLIQAGIDMAAFALQMIEVMNAQEPVWNSAVICTMIKNPDSSPDTDMVPQYIKPIEFLISLERLACPSILWHI